MRRASLLLVALALGVALTACGDDGDDGGGGAASGSGDKERFCELASRDDIAGLDDFDPTRDGDMAELDAALDDLRDAAPEEIRDDVETVADGLRELVGILSTMDTSDPDAMAELAERTDELEALQERMESSVERVDRYLEEECGIDPSS